MPSKSRYAKLIEHIFLARYKVGMQEVPFERSDIESAAQELGVVLPKNLGDVIYSFRYRRSMPEAIVARAPGGMCWIIRAGGPSRYRFVAVRSADIAPNPMLETIKIPDATPGVITRYALSDEQALLARLRYNRLVDIFTRVACYSLQSHLRTTVPDMGQVETDEVYVGVDRRGAHYVFPLQAKGGRDVLSVVQIEQDIAMCSDKFPDLICRPLAAQFLAGEVIAMFELTDTDEGVVVVSEKHYRLVPPSDLTPEELLSYRRRPDEGQ